MRSILFFDLPTEKKAQRKAYSTFVKNLKKTGFAMMQESVYSKLVLNSQQSNALVERIRKKAPKKGIIQVMNVTEKQFAQIEFITGNSSDKIINSEERLVIL